MLHGFGEPYGLRAITQLVHATFVQSKNKLWPLRSLTIGLGEHRCALCNSQRTTNAEDDQHILCTALLEPVDNSNVEKHAPEIVSYIDENGAKHWRLDIPDHEMQRWAFDLVHAEYGLHCLSNSI